LGFWKKGGEKIEGWGGNSKKVPTEKNTTGLGDSKHKAEGSFRRPLKKKGERWDCTKSKKFDDESNKTDVTKRARKEDCVGKKPKKRHKGNKKVRMAAVVL